MTGPEKTFLRGGFARPAFVLALGAACFLAGRWTSDANQADRAEILPARAIAADRQAPSSSAVRQGDEAMAAPAPNWSDDNWRSLHAAPATLARNERLAALIEELAQREPARALGLAQTETNRLLQERLLEAALRGWARAAPLDSGRWALTQTEPGSREAALKAVFSGAVSADPATAMQAGTRLVTEHPEEAVGLGGHLIDALCGAGDFEAAVRFAASGSPNLQLSWTGAAYAQWAALQPERAAEAAAAVADPVARSLALHGVIGGWSDADPASAVQFAAQLPDDSDKSSMVGQALLRWTRIDLKAASDWINGHEMGPAMDQGVASVATRDYIQPDVAVSWAESVVDPKLRSSTLVDVLRRWATTDLSGAKHYFETTTYLGTEDRQEVAGLISTLSGDSDHDLAGTANPKS